MLFLMIFLVCGVRLLFRLNYGFLPTSLHIIQRMTLMHGFLESITSVSFPQMLKCIITIQVIPLVHAQNCHHCNCVGNFKKVANDLFVQNQQYNSATSCFNSGFSLSVVVNFSLSFKFIIICALLSHVWVCLEKITALFRQLIAY